MLTCTRAAHACLGSAYLPRSCSDRQGEAMQGWVPTCRSGARMMACGPTSSSTASSGIAAHASRNSTRDLKLWT